MTYPPDGYQPPNVPDPHNPSEYPVAATSAVPNGYPPPPTLPTMTPPVPPSDIYLGTMGPSVPVKRRSGWGFVVSGIAVVALVGAGAFFAADLLGSGGGAAAQHLPGSSAAFATINLDVSADQQLRLSDLAGKVPELEDTGSPEALIDSVLADLERDAGAEGSLTGWVGMTASVALWTNSDGEPFSVLSVESTDDDAAGDGLAKLSEAAGDEEVGYQVADGWATIVGGEGVSQDTVASVTGEIEKNPLSESDTFSSAAGWFDDEDVVYGWVDLDAVGEVFSAAFDDYDGVPGMVGPFGGLLSVSSEAASGQYAIGGQATDYGVELRSQGFGVSEVAPGSSTVLNDLAGLPAGELGVVAQLPDDTSSSLAWLGMTAFGMGMSGGSEEDNPLSDALSGATVRASMSNMSGDAEPVGWFNVSAGSADQASALRDLIGEAPVDITVDGSELTGTTPGYAEPDERLGDADDFDTVTDGALSEVNTAVYLDLGALEDEDLPGARTLGVVQGVEGGQPAGIYRLVIE